MQHDLPLQVIDVRLSNHATPAVGDALRHVLRHSGYRLCDDLDVAELTALPLPASHLQLRPLALRTELQTLAGPAWALSMD